MSEKTIKTVFICDNDKCKSVLGVTVKSEKHARKHATDESWRFVRGKVYCGNH